MKKHISQRIARISQTVVAKSLTQASKSMHLLRRSPSFIFQSLFVKLSMWARLLTDPACTICTYRCYVGIRCEGPAFFPLQQERCCKQVQLGRSLPWNLYYLYPSSGSCFRGVISFVAPLLAYSLAFGFVMLAWVSVRVLILRKSIEHLKVKNIEGLRMCKWTLTNFSPIIYLFQQSQQWGPWAYVPVDYAENDGDICRLFFSIPNTFRTRLLTCPFAHLESIYLASRNTIKMFWNYEIIDAIFHKSDISVG